MDLRDKASKMQQMKTLQPFSNKEDFELSQRMAKLISFSTFIEQDGNQQQRYANAVVLQDLSQTTKISVFSLAREIYMIKGKVGFSGALYRSIINGSGEFMHRLRFRFNDKRDSCVAYTRDIVDGELLETPAYTIQQAIKEGLFAKQGSKWLTRPENMLINRVSYMFAVIYGSHLYIGSGNFSDSVDDFELKEDVIEVEAL